VLVRKFIIAIFLKIPQVFQGILLLTKTARISNVIYLFYLSENEFNFMEPFVAYSDDELMQEIKADNMFAFDVLYKSI
jgi:hypothetical protein